MLVHDTLIQNGLSFDAAEAWLDDVRKTGLRNRFTLPAMSTWSDLPIQEIHANVTTADLCDPLGA